jgi:hypothetical protein
MENLVAWGRVLPGFNHAYAVDGITLAQCITDGVEDRKHVHIPGLGAENPNMLFELALDTAWIFWLDDRFDSHPEGSARRLSALEQFDNENAGPSSAPEVFSLSLLASTLGLKGKSDAARKLWKDTAIELFHAFRNNEMLSRSEISWSYAEYLQNGEISSAVWHFVATISLLYELDMVARMPDPRFQRLLRNLSLALRLRNDLVSITKEREEGDRANALIVVEQLLSSSQAVEFIEAQRAGHERLVLAGIADMPPDDPFARIANIMLHASHSFYVMDTERYSGR